MSNEGKKVKAHYRGTLDDGTQFDCSYDRNEPIEFTCMAGQMIPGFDAAVKDMAVGEKKTVKIPAAEQPRFNERWRQTVAEGYSETSFQKGLLVIIEGIRAGMAGQPANWQTPQ